MIVSIVRPQLTTSQLSRTSSETKLSALSSDILKTCLQCDPSLIIWLPRSNSLCQFSWSASCSRACQKHRSGCPWVERFWFLDPCYTPQKYRNCDLMLFVYLSVCRNVLILEQVHFRFIEVNIPCMGEGNRKKLSFPSTVTTSCPNFVPQDTHSLRHKLKTSYSFACSSQMS